MATHRTSYLWASVLLIFIISLFGVGCKGCNKAKKNVETAEAPADPWQHYVDLLAQRVPADASNALFIVDFTTALSAYPGFRARVSAYMRDYATLEADLRNTLDIDPAHPTNLKGIGINPRGGAMCAIVHDQPLCGVVLSDADTFVQHFTHVLQGQPFNFRAPVVSTELPGGGTLLRFYTTEGGPLKAAIIRTDELGFVLTNPRISDIESLAATLEVPEKHSLQNNPAFQKLLKHNPRASVFAWIGPNAFTQIAQGNPKIAPFIPQNKLIQGGLIGIQLHADAIDGWFSLLLNPDNPGVKDLLTRPDGTHAADFSKLVTDDAYMLIRLHAEPTAVKQTLQALFQNDTNEDAVKAVFGDVQFEQRLTEALGSDLIIEATRARLLTLMQLFRNHTFNVHTIGDGLGIIVAYQLRDEDKMRELLQLVTTQKSGLLAHHAEINGDDNAASTEYWTVKSGAAKGLVLFVANNALIATSGRQKDDVIQRIQADEALPLKNITAEEPRALRGKTDDIGLYIDINHVLNHSLGRIAGSSLSSSMRDALQVFDTFWIRGALEDDTWFDGTWRLQLSGLPEP